MMVPIMEIARIRKIVSDPTVKRGHTSKGAREVSDFIIKNDVFIDTMKDRVEKIRGFPNWRDGIFNIVLFNVVETSKRNNIMLSDGDCCQATNIIIEKLE